jgi:hypothetical protein
MEHSVTISNLNDKLDKLLERSSNEETINVNQQDEYTPLHNLPNTSRFMIKTKTIQDLIEESSTRSNFAIRLIPHVFSFEEIYRHCIRPNKGDGNLQLDNSKLNSIINSAMERKKCNHDQSKVRRNLSNHFSNLNSFFKKIKNCQKEKVYLKEFSRSKLTKEHLKLVGYDEYVNNKKKFRALDDAIDKLVSGSRNNLKDLIREFEECNDYDSSSSEGQDSEFKFQVPVQTAILNLS